MKCEWKQIKVGDIGTIVTGKTPLTKKAEYWGGSIPFITPKDLQRTKHVFDTERFITDMGLESMRGCKLPSGAVCVSCIGNIGYVAMTNQNCISNQQINSIIVSENYDPNFVYYLMKSLWPFFKNYEGQSTTLSILNKTQFSKIEIAAPDLSVQKRIASILSSLDDKIELNNKINDNLERQAQAIYQEWFGDVDAAKEQGTLSDICSYSKDRVAVSELDICMYFSTENMLPEKAGATEASSLPTAEQTTACHAGDTLVSNIRPYFKKIVYCHEACGCSADVLCFVPVDSKYSAYLYSTLYADKFFDFMVAGSKGTKMPRGDKQQIMTYPVTLPTDEELDRFNLVAVPILEQIQNNRNENKTLSLLRDNLLPKLLSGEVSVDNV